MRGDRRGGLLSFAGFTCTGAAALVFGWQALTWLMTSAWKPVSVITALNWLHVRWAISPGAWSDLHQSLVNTPLAVALLAAAALCFVLYALVN
jgi:hypothetical protein